MSSTTYSYRLNGSWFILGVFFYGGLGFFLAEAASTGHYPPFFPHALGQRPSPEVILLEWLGCAVFCMGLVYTYYRFYFSKSSAKGLIHLTDAAISIQTNTSGDALTIPYESITKLKASTIYRVGRVICIWHNRGETMIKEALLATDSFDELYSQLREHIPE